MLIVRVILCCEKADPSDILPIPIYHGRSSMNVEYMIAIQWNTRQHIRSLSSLGTVVLEMLERAFVI